MIGASFNGGWEYRPKSNPFAELTGRQAAWEPVTLPHDAMLAAGRDGAQPDRGPIAFFRTGAYEYRKVFTPPEDWRGSAVAVRFEGIYRHAFVYLNGDLVGQRPSGYAELIVDLGDLLRFGEENVLRVEARTGDDTRWYAGGGMYRNTTLYVGGPLRVGVDGVRVSTPDVDDRLAAVVVATDVVNGSVAARTVRLRTELTCGDRSVGVEETPVTVRAGSTETVTQRLYVTDPSRWSVDHPILHACRTAVVDGGQELDSAVTTFGLRSLQVDPVRGLRINGERVHLRGACIHHDNGILGAATITRADERRVELLKAAGFNAIRSAHNPMSRALLDACDRVGVLVMDELTDSWTVAKRDQDGALDFGTWWPRDVEAMIAKDFNHPSVIMYSIGNEILEVGTPAGARLSRALVEHIRNLDPTRFVTNGINGFLAVRDEIGQLFAAPPPEEPSETVGLNTAMANFTDRLDPAMRTDRVGDRIEEASATLDVAGYNYLDARYEVDAKRHPHRVIVGTETSPLGLARRWPYIMSHSHVIGDFTWTGWDYLGEVGVGRTERGGDGPKGFESFEAPYPWLLAACGDIDITGHRLPVSYFREVVFGLRRDPYVVVQPVGAAPVTHSSPWSWGDAEPSWTWPGHEGEMASVEVYADADEVELHVNGVPAGRAPAGVDRGFRAAIDVPYEPGELVAVAYRDGTECGRTALRTAGDDLRLAVTVDRPAISADDQDLAFVAIELTDSGGVVHPAADRTVTVEVVGPGVLQGLGSADPCTEESFLGTSHRTYAGRALAAVRPTGPGEIAVTVTADGCDPVAVAVTAVAPRGGTGGAGGR
jgi:beta-galactosidase